MTEESGFDSQQGLKIYFFSKASRPPLGSTQPPIQMIPWTPSPGVKWSWQFHLSLLPRLRKSAPIHSLSLTLSRHAEEQLYLKLKSSCSYMPNYKLMIRTYVHSTPILCTPFSLNHTSYNKLLSGDWIPMGARFPVPVQIGLEAHSASCIMSTGSFLRVKCLGCGADHPPPPSAKVTNGLELYLCHPSVAAQACYGVTFTSYLPEITVFLVNVQNLLYYETVVHIVCYLRSLMRQLLFPQSWGVFHHLPG
jgi:hypothetical protein